MSIFLYFYMEFFLKTCIWYNDQDQCFKKNTSLYIHQKYQFCSWFSIQWHIIIRSKISGKDGNYLNFLHSFKTVLQILWKTKRILSSFTFPVIAFAVESLRTKWSWVVDVSGITSSTVSVFVKAIPIYQETKH